MERNKVFKVLSGGDIFVLTFNSREKDLFLKKIPEKTGWICGFL